MKYYVAKDRSLYEQVRLSLDSAWGLPNDKGTDTCIAPAAVAPVDQDGNLLLAVSESFLAYEEVAAILPGLIESGAVEEVSRDYYIENVYPEPALP